MPGDVEARGFDWLGVVYIALILVVMFAPVLFVRRKNSPPSDERSDDGRGGGPRKPPDRPPLGGPPLPDAEQSRRRLRDHRRLSNLAPRRRGRSLHRPRRRERTAVP